MLRSSTGACWRDQIFWKSCCKNLWWCPCKLSKKTKLVRTKKSDQSKFVRTNSQSNLGPTTFQNFKMKVLKLLQCKVYTFTKGSHVLTNNCIKIKKDTNRFHSSHTQICQRCYRSRKENRVDFLSARGRGRSLRALTPCWRPTPWRWGSHAITCSDRYSWTWRPIWRQWFQRRKIDYWDLLAHQKLKKEIQLLNYIMCKPDQWKTSLQMWLWRISVSPNTIN